MKTRCLLGVLCLNLAVQAQQTNVLLIIADDLGIESLAAFNDNGAASLPSTPTIDGLASSGILFNRFYAYSSCSPTRASIMTGRHAFRTGVYSPFDHDLQPNDFTLPEALIESGVISTRLACIGKWHLGDDADTPNTIGGWPHYAGSLGGGVDSFYNWEKTVNGVTAATTNYATTDNVDDGISWISEQGTNSWFLWISFNAPHTPHHRPPNDLHDYDTIADEGEDDSREHFEAMVQAMDTEIARLLTAVDLSDTTVIFMGDNGTIRNVIQQPIPRNHGKATIYEGGIRVPMLVSGAAVDASVIGTIYSNNVHSCDLYNTILELFGVDAVDVVPKELIFDSRSLAPVLRGEAYTREPSEVVSILSDNAGLMDWAIVEGDYKVIISDTGTQEFYNIEVDIRESSNLLAGTLSPTEQAAYDSLTNKLVSYANIPHCYSAYMTNGSFNIETGWFDNDGFTLYRADQLTSNTVWASVPGQEMEDGGGAVLVLRDPAPPSSNAYYRVTTP